MEIADLPKELQHDDVVDVSNASEPKYDCYHVVLDRKDVPVMYRAQWKDDWEILFAKVDEKSGDPRIRLVIIERATDSATVTWRRYAFAGVAAGTVGLYLWFGNLLVETGRMGSFPKTVGLAVGVVALTAIFVYGLQAVVDEWRGTAGGARP